MPSSNSGFFFWCAICCRVWIVIWLTWCSFGIYNTVINILRFTCNNFTKNFRIAIVLQILTTWDDTSIPRFLSRSHHPADINTLQDINRGGFQSLYINSNMISLSSRVKSNILFAAGENFLKYLNLGNFAHKKGMFRQWMLKWRGMARVNCLF